MSILKDTYCREKIRVLPVEIKENDYMTAVENNTRNIYGDKFSQYGYIYKNSIVMYDVSRFAEQDSQTQMAALLFEVQFFAHTIYPPYNVPIDCEIKKKKQSSDDDQITMFFLQPVVELNETKRKFFDRNPIYISVSVKTTDIDNQEQYKTGDKVKASIYMGQPWVMRGKCSYNCLGTIQGIKTDAYYYKKIENYEQKYIDKMNKLLGQKKKQRNNKGPIEEIPGTSLQHQEQNIDLDLEDIESDSDQSENNNKKNGDDSKKTVDQEQKKKKKVRIYTGGEDQESEDEYDTEEEEEEEEDEDQEEGEEEDDLNEYGLDDEDEDADDGEKEEVEAEEEVE